MVIVLCLTAANATVTTAPTVPTTVTDNLTLIIGAAAGSLSLLLLIVASVGGGLVFWYGRRPNTADQGQQGPQQRRQQEPVGAARPRAWQWQLQVKKDRSQIVGDKRGSVDNLSKDMYRSSTAFYSLGYPYHNGTFTPRWSKGGGYSR